MMIRQTEPPSRRCRPSRRSLARGLAPVFAIAGLVAVSLGGCRGDGKAASPWLVRAFGNCGTCAVVTVSGNAILTTGHRLTPVVAWRLRTGAELRRYNAPVAVPTDLACSPDGRWVAATSGNSLNLWEIRSGRPWAPPKEKLSSPESDWQWLKKALFTRPYDQGGFRCNGAVTSIAFSPNSKHLLTGSLDHMARLWEVETGVELRRFEGHSHYVIDVAFSPDGNRILTGSNSSSLRGTDNSVRLWNTQTGREIARFGCHDCVSSVAFSPDGKRVLAACWRAAMSWDIQTAKRIRCFVGHSQLVTCVAFSPDGKRILTGGLDQTARIWDYQTGKLLRLLVGHPTAIQSVQFSPDGALALTAGYRTVRVWNADTTAP